MQPMGNDKTGVPPVGGRASSPFAYAPPQPRPPYSSGPGGVSEAAGIPQATTLYPGSSAVQAPGPSSGPPVRFNAPIATPPTASPPTSVPSVVGSQFPHSQVPPTAQAPPPFRGSPSIAQQAPASFSQTPISLPGSQFPSARPPPLSQMPSVPMGIPAQNRGPFFQGNMPRPSMGVGAPPPSMGIGAPPPIRGYANMPPPPVDSLFETPKPMMQQPSQVNPSSQVPPVNTPQYYTHQGLAPPLPVAPPMAYASRDFTPHSIAGPPLGGSLQGLIEEFESLSIASAPGSVDPGVDFRSLPRPHEGDTDTKITETYPFNCHPRYLRLTTQAIPSSQSLYARWHLPLGAVVHPLAEAPDGEDVPVVNFGPAGVIRCRRCRTYINPYATFTDGGRKWRCNLCALLNDVPVEYFCGLDASGLRLDIDQRPELKKGSVEFVAPTEYMVRPPMPPLYFFLIDVSWSAVQSGMLEVVAKTVKSCLDRLPGFPRTQIGFITYDSTLHFYNMKSSLTQPQMMVVSDLDDIFLPLPDDLLVNLSDSRNVVDAFLDNLPTMFQGNSNVESALGPALKAALMVMGQLGGKLLIFESTLPSLGIGRLKLRGEDLRIYGTDKEHTLRIPEDPFYKQMAAELTKCQIGVDVFVFNDKYSDVASLGSLAKYTGGQVYYYPSFQASIHQEKLRHDLARDLTRETAWEAVMRIRCGKGVRFTTYHGHFMLRSTDLLALPAVDCDKAFAMQLSLEETLLTTQTVYFQVALLYTSSTGERRIRVHTAAAPVVTDLGEMYRQANTGAVISLLSRLAVEKSLSHKLEDARQFVQLRIVKSLKEYRNLYVVQHRIGGRLIYPESLKLLPLYGLALCKSMALRGGYADIPLDERCAVGYSIMILPVRRMMKFLYPCLIRIDESIKSLKDGGEIEPTPKALPLSVSSLDSKGIYVLDDGLRFVIWIGRMVHPDTISDLFGANSTSFPDLSKVVLTEQGNDASNNLLKLLSRLRDSDPSSYQLCHIVRQGEQARESMLFLANLIEDQTAGISGYVDWIIQLYRQTQQNP